MALAKKMTKKMKTDEEILHENFNSFDWEEEENQMNVIQKFKSKHGADDYLEKFTKEEIDSELNNARRWLRNFWEDVVLKIPSDHPLWKIEDRRRLTMKAMAHVNTVEPLDEKLYLHLKFYEQSGHYWEGKNRPERYDDIEKILQREHLRNIDGLQQIPYRGKREEIKRTT